MGSSTSIPISVLILTLNEEINIGRCIEALAWSDDVVLLDSHSTDSTREIARQLGARVFKRRFDDFAGQRNYALDHIEFRHPWVLHLDADEIVTTALRDEMAEVIKESNFKAFRLPSKLMFRRKWLKYSGMYPSYQVRLGRIEALRFEQVGHGQRESLEATDVGTIKSPYLHFSLSKGLNDWIERHNRYSTDEALQACEFMNHEQPGWYATLKIRDKTLRRRTLKVKVANWSIRPLLRFIYMFFFRLGFLDGRAGFTYCRLLTNYEYWIVLKIREMKKLD